MGDLQALQFQVPASYVPACSKAQPMLFGATVGLSSSPKRVENGLIHHDL